MPLPKISVSTDPQQWQPGLIPRSLALISTVDSEGVPNIAARSGLQVVSSEPSILLFSASCRGTTEQNIEKTRCFGVNPVHGSLVHAVAGMQYSGQQRIDKSGFTLMCGQEIEAPLVEQCRAHLECRLIETKQIGSGFLVFGEIVAASLSQDILEKKPRDRHAALDLALGLEDGLYAAVDRPRPTQVEALNEHNTRYVYLLNHARPELFCEQLVRDHVSHLKQLEDQGLLEICGPFPEHHGGIVMLRGVNEQQALAIARSDPFVISGAETFELRKLEVSCRDNNHMGMG